MIGAVLLVVFMAVLFPVGFLMSGAVASALHGWLLSTDADDRYADRPDHRAMGR